MKKILITLGAVAVLAVGLAVPAGAVSVHPVTCGTITGHAVLGADLVCAEVHIAAHATVDLGGHQLEAASVTVDHATIKDGVLWCRGGSMTVTGSRFTRAGVLGWQCSMTVTGNRMRGPVTGATLYNAGVAEVLAVDLPVVVDGNDIAGYHDGISAIGTTNLDTRDLTDLTVTGNRLHDNVLGAEVGCGGACLIDGNTISRNLRGVIGGSTSAGAITITNNWFRFNTYQPFTLYGTVVVGGNSAYGNGQPCDPVAC